MDSEGWPTKENSAVSWRNALTEKDAINQEVMQVLRENSAMKEYAFDYIVNHADEGGVHAEGGDMPPRGWYPSVDTCMVGIMEIMRGEPNASSFVFNIVQRSHTR